MTTDGFSVLVVTESLSGYKIEMYIDKYMLQIPIVDHSLNSHEGAVDKNPPSLLEKKMSRKIVKQLVTHSGRPRNNNVIVIVISKKR